jgi:hypothetical protein
MPALNSIKKISLLFLLTLVLSNPSSAQILNVQSEIQDYDQWCWAASSQCILAYYGFTQSQCAIAEYTRENATFQSFGTVNCCTDATQGCNNWNYNYGYTGSIQEILIHFGNLQNTGMANPLTPAEITSELQNNRLFVIRWGWSTGGGHFLVGYGINGNNLYYMNPWFGEGLKISTINYVDSGSGGAGTTTATHTWTHTNEITSNVSGIPGLNSSQPFRLYPNPAQDKITITGLENNKTWHLEIINLLGQTLLSEEPHTDTSGTILLEIPDLPKGTYLLKISSPGLNYSRIQKLIIS